MMAPSQFGILAIAPGTRHIGYALMECGELVRCGVRTFRGKKTRQTLWANVLLLLDHFVACYRLDAFAIVGICYAQRRLRPILRNLVSRLKRWGRTRGLVTRCVPPTTLKAWFCREKKTRAMLAEEIVRRHAFLARYLTSQQPSLYRLQLFDAVAVAVFLSENGARAARTHHPRTPSSLGNLSLRRIEMTAPFGGLISGHGERGRTPLTERSRKPWRDKPQRETSSRYHGRPM